MFVWHSSNASDKCNFDFIESIARHIFHKLELNFNWLNVDMRSTIATSVVSRTIKCFCSLSIALFRYYSFSQTFYFVTHFAHRTITIASFQVNRERKPSSRLLSIVLVLSAERVVVGAQHKIISVLLLFFSLSAVVCWLFCWVCLSIDTMRIAIEGH